MSEQCIKSFYSLMEEVVPTTFFFKELKEI